MWKKERKPPIRIMESKTQQKSQCVNIFLVFEHKGNTPINEKWGNVIYWVQGYLPIMKVGLGCTVGKKLHVTLRYTKGVADMQSQEF
jgi:hypothetical protein